MLSCLNNIFNVARRAPLRLEFHLVSSRDSGGMNIVAGLGSFKKSSFYYEIFSSSSKIDSKREGLFNFSNSFKSLRPRSFIN